MICCVGLIVVVAGNAEAAGTTRETFDGRVTDSRTGKALADAEITILGWPGSARTDADGRFTWRTDVRAPFVLLVSLPGGRVMKPIQIDRLDAAAVLHLRVEPAVSEEVTVAAGVAPSIDAAPGAGMTMLSARDVALRGPANLLQALEGVPGVTQVSEGQAAVPAVRGLARGRTLILIDGSRVTTERRVGPSATFMDPAIIEGIDIARGPGSVAYGSDAFGGVISIRTKRPGYSGTRVDAAATLGAGIPDRRAEVTVGHGFGTGGLLATAHVRDVGNYDAPDDEVPNSGWADRGFLFRAEKRAGSGLFSASWQSDFGRDIERPRNNSSSVRFYYPFENSHRFNASWERADAGGLDLVRVTGFAGTYEQRTDQDRVPTPSTPRDIERADISARDFQVRALAETRLGRAFVEFGADVNGRHGLEAHDIFVQYDLDGDEVGTNDNLSVDSARRLDTGLFAQASTAIGTLATLTGGLRLDRVSNVNEGGYFGDRSVSNSAAAGFAAVAIRPLDHTTLTAQLSRGFRDPTLSDRFFRGPSGRGFITGNPDLVPETSLQLDLGASYATARMRVAGYFYQYRITDLVERYEEDTDFFAFRNRGRARIRGVEFEAQADVGSGFFLEAAAQLSRGLALDDGSALDDTSPENVSVTLRKALNDQVIVFGRLATYADDDRPGPSEIETPGHTNLDIGGSWFASDRLELRAAVRNLLNDEYYASPDRRFVFAPGRNAFVTVSVTFP